MRIFCVKIEGLGKIDGTGQDNGYLFTSDLPPGFDKTLDSHDWVTVMPEPPNPGTTSVEPYEPRFRFAPFDLMFSAGRLQNFIAELFLYKQTQATTTLAEDVAVGDTSFDLTSTSDISADDVIYVNGETMKIGAVSGLTVFPSERGHYSSDAAAHLEGASVYKRPPFFGGRRVIFYTYDTEDGSSFDTAGEARMRGVIDGTVRMDKARMHLPVKQLLAPLSKAKLNRDPATPRAYNLVERTFKDDAPAYPGQSVYAGTITMNAARSNVLKDATSLAGGASARHFEIDGDLYLLFGQLTRLQPEGRISQGANDTLSTVSPANLDREPIEVFVAGSKLGVSNDGGTVTSSMLEMTLMPASFTVDGTSFTLDSEQQDAYVHHPLAIACALLFSTSADFPTPEEFDVLKGPNFGADLRFLFADSVLAKAHQLITDAVGIGQQIDQIVLGEGGKPFEFLRLIKEKLLHPYDYKIGVDKNGKLDFFRAQLPDVDDYAAARANELVPLAGEDVAYVVDNGQANATDIIEAQLGGTPYVDGRSITLRADTGQPDRPYILKGGADAELDLSTINSQTGVNQAVEIVTSRALLQHYAAKRLRISVKDWSQVSGDYSLGQFVTLDDIRINDAWLLDKDGNRVSEISNDVQWVGQIISRTPRQGFAGFDLEILFAAQDIVRRRAPSARVASYDSGTLTITLDSSVFHPDGDGLQFNGGDRIKIVQPDGTVRDDGGSLVDSTTADTIVVDGGFVTADPVDGDYIRLADYDDYSNAGLDTYTALVYVYLADTDATLGTAEDDAHIYGI